MAVPFHTGPDGKKLGSMNAHFTASYIAPNSPHEEEHLRANLPEDMRLPLYTEAAVRLDFIDYQGTHWVRAANGRVTPIEKLKGAGFDELPRTLFDPDRPSRFTILGWMKRLRHKFKPRQHADR
jgi:hypothetical protein